MKSEFHAHRPTHRVESEICQHGAAEVACVPCVPCVCDCVVTRGVVLPPVAPAVVVAPSHNVKSEFHAHCPTQWLESKICQHGAAVVP